MGFEPEVAFAQEVAATVPSWISIIPPLLAIAVALVFRRVIPALFLGIWFGAWAVRGLRLEGIWTGLLDTVQVYVLESVADVDHAAIIIFSFMIGGMVGIISRNGGMQGVVDRIVGWARSPRRGQIITATMGILIFFDDYANSLVVGNTMRPVTDRLRVSREKLAYLVDSTAAPVASLAFVTTWIGYEVGLIGESVAQIPSLTESPYSIFLNSLAYSFYPVLALLFVFIVATGRRDFGAMHRAEIRARERGEVLAPEANVDPAAAAEGSELQPPAHKPRRAVNAVLPVVILVVAVLGGLYVTGEGDSLREIVGTADAYRALMWGSLLGVLTAGVLSVAQRILSLDQTVDAWYNGVRSMLFAMIILVLAWALSEITQALGTADFLMRMLGDRLPPGIIPAIVFVLAALTAFATGTSWGTMGILMPLVVPLTWSVLEQGNGQEAVLYSAVACVLAGAVWGDHCSPISDTTVLSSMASGCDHVDHVRTQLPYAILVGAVALVIGTIPTGFGFPWIASMLIGVGVLAGVMMVWGRRVP